MTTSKGAPTLIVVRESGSGPVRMIETLRECGVSASFREVDRLDIGALDPHDIVVVESRMLPRGDIDDFLSRGGTVLIVPDGELPSTADHGVGGFSRYLGDSEWYLIVGAEKGAAFGRVPREFLFQGPLFTVEAPEGSETLLSCNVAMRDIPVVARVARGAGNVIHWGLPFDLAQQTSDALVRFITATLLGQRSQRSTHHASAMGVGVIGYGPHGGMGNFHGTAVCKTEGLTFTSAVDPDGARRKQAEADFPGVQTYASASELISDAATEIVIIATPPRTHFALAKSMLLGGKHVVIEKPMCLTVAEADELIALATSSGLTLTVNQNRRWDQDFRTIRTLIEEGALGEVFNIETFVGGFEHPCRAWHSDESISGGIAYDWGAHHIDWIIQLYGEAPVEVRAIGHKRKWFEVTNLDQIRINMTFADGREATFAQSELAAIRKPKFYIQGTKATLSGVYRPLVVERVLPNEGYSQESFHHAEAPAELTLGTYQPDRGVALSTVPLLPPDRYGLHRNLADHFHLGLPLEVQAEQVRDVIAVLEYSHASSNEGGRSYTL